MINNISVDYLMQKENKIYEPLTYAILSIHLLVLIIMLISMYFNMGKKTFMVIKISMIILVYIFFLFKTIIVIPCLQLIIINLIPQVLAKFAPDSGI